MSSPSHSQPGPSPAAPPKTAASAANLHAATDSPASVVSAPAPTRVEVNAPAPSPSPPPRPGAALPGFSFVPSFTSTKELAIYCLRNAGKSFMIGYGARTGLHLALRIIALLRSSPAKLLDIDAIFGKGSPMVRADAVRLGLFFGGFTGLFEFAYGLLQKHRGPDDGWNAAIAGAIGGLSILFQRGDTHRTLALYLFARVVQCVYNGFKARDVISPLPHGDAILFSVSSAVVMYCYVLRPDALPRSFYNFILRTGPISETSLRVVRHTTYSVPFNTEPLKEYIRARFDTPPSYLRWLGSRPSTLVPTDVIPALAAATTPAPAAAAAAAVGGLPPSARPLAPGPRPQLSATWAWVWRVLQGKRAAAKARVAAAQARAAMSGVTAASAAAAVAGTGAGSVSKAVEVAAETGAGIVPMDIRLSQPLLPPSATSAAAVAAASAAASVAAAAPDATAAAVVPLPAPAQAILREGLIHQLIGVGSGPHVPVSALDSAAGVRGRAAAWAMPTVTSAQVSHAKKLTAAIALAQTKAKAKAAAAAAAAAAAGTAVAPGAELVGVTLRRGGPVVATVGPSKLSGVLASSGVAPADAVIGSCGSTFAKIPCLGLHPELPHSCTANAVYAFHRTAAKILPLYSSLTIVPLVLFKNLKLLKDPLRYLGEASLSILRSCMFLGSFVGVYQGMICVHRNATPFAGRESKGAIFMAGIICGFVSILFERKSRRSELALYVFPRAFDAVVYLLREKSLLPGPALGSAAVENVWVWCAAMGALSYYFVHEPEQVSGLVYTVLRHLFGRDPKAMRAKAIAEAEKKAAQAQLKHDTEEIRAT